MTFFSHKFLLKHSTLPETLVTNLSRYGIVYAHQLIELADKQPASLKRVTRMGENQLAKLLNEQLEPLPTMSAFTYQHFTHPPLQGLVLATKDSPILVERREKLKHERGQLSDMVMQLEKKGNLPLKMDLTSHLPEIGDQGPWGSCVGWGSTAAREFPVPTTLSPGWAYRGAKALDGQPNVEGSWLNFAFEYFYRYGHVPESLYSYQDAKDNKPLEPFHHHAAQYRIDGFVDLILDDEDYHLMPTLLKGVLSGVLIPDLGPQPVSIGVAVYESAQTQSTHRSGLWTIPLPGEDCLGGHAMAVVGYFDKTHPDNPLGESYFLVRNSWGLNYAFENPLGHPGHALIPEGFFKRHDCLHSGILSVAEASPMKKMTGVMAALWEKSRQLIR